jgi:hypothetical protein
MNFQKQYNSLIFTVNFLEGIMDGEFKQFYIAWLKGFPYKIPLFYMYISALHR